MCIVYRGYITKPRCARATNSDKKVPDLEGQTWQVALNGGMPILKYFNKLTMASQVSSKMLLIKKVLQEKL